MSCYFACVVLITIVIVSIAYSFFSDLFSGHKINSANVKNSSDILLYKTFRNVSYENMFDNHTENSVSLGEILNQVNSTKGPPYFKQTISENQDDGCICKGYGCACCVTLCVPEISLNDTGCLNFAYLPNEYGITVSLTIDGSAIINETISARNPPPLCMEPPFMDNFIHICIRFYDLDVTVKKFHGCVLLEMRMFHIFSLKEWHLGCFDMDLVTTEQGMHMKNLLQSHATNATENISTVKRSFDWKAFKQVLLSKMNSTDSILITSN